MAKKRKTRREKKVADNRHTLYHLETSSPQESKVVAKKEAITPASKTYQNPTKNVVSLNYVAKDVRKILFISTILIATQIVIYIVMGSV